MHNKLTPVITIFGGIYMKLSIGESIRELRRIHGKTQEALANSLGVTAQAVSRWESGATYPDMELIPSIANFFGISIDRLFGYSGERETKIAAILEKIDSLNDESWRDDANLDECIVILRRALDEFPGNERIMHRLAMILKQAGWARHHEWLHYDEDGHLRGDFDRHRKNPYWTEAIDLFDRLSVSATDRDVRHSAVGELVLLCRTVGDSERAKVIANSMPGIGRSREVLLATACSGKEETKYLQESVIALLRQLRELFVYALVNDIDNFKTEMPISKIQGLIAIYDLIFDDGNMGPHHANVCDLYLYLSRLQWEYGCHDEAFESLDKALWHAKKWDSLTPDHKYTAPLARYADAKMPPQKPGELARNLPDDWPMWMNPDCAKVAAEIKADPRWSEWVARTQA